MTRMYLDPQIRDWVLLPIMLVMVLVGLLRHHGMKLIQSIPKAQVKQLRESAAMLRSQNTRTNLLLTPAGYEARKAYLTSRFEKKEYLKNQNIDSQAPNPLTDPAAMEGTMEMMKKNMAMLIPQTVIMSWISYFFAGFVLSKLPFPLTLRFKSMVQRGIETTDMDVRWVSSLSWYFLNLFGLTSVYTLILDDARSAGGGMQDQMQMQMMGAPQPLANPAEIQKAFTNEVESFALLNYEWHLTGIEERLLGKAAGPVAFQTKKRQ